MRHFSLKIKQNLEQTTAQHLMSHAVSKNMVILMTQGVKKKISGVHVIRAQQVFHGQEHEAAITERH